MYKFIISKLLYLANQRPNAFEKYSFYKLKDSLLKKYGKKIGTDYQYISKECHTCFGTGVYKCEHKMPETCWSCSGTGKYEEYVSQLDKYEFGKHDFHLPVRKYQRRDSGFIDAMIKVNIKDYIRHKYKNPYSSDEAQLWLFLLFDIKTFKKMFGRSYRFYVKSRYILLFLSNLKFLKTHKHLKKTILKQDSNVPSNGSTVEIHDELPF